MDEPEFGFPPEMPEEQRAMIADKIIRAKMERDADAHQLYGFVTGLSIDDMKVMRGILRGAQSDTNVAAFYEGVISVHLAAKESLCWACGANHDDDLANVLVTEPAEPSSDPPYDTATVDAADVALSDDGVISVHLAANTADVALSDDGTTLEPFNKDDLVAHAAFMGVEFMGPIGPNTPVRCMGCDLKYVSYKDRALRQDCSTCMQKAKWG